MPTSAIDHLADFLLRAARRVRVRREMLQI
jgi:hypothetical protein